MITYANRTHECDREDTVSKTVPLGALSQTNKIHVRCKDCGAIVPCETVDP